MSYILNEFNYFIEHIGVTTLLSVTSIFVRAISLLFETNLLFQNIAFNIIVIVELIAIVIFLLFTVRWYEY